MLCDLFDLLVICELLYDFMYMCTWLIDGGWVEAGPALCCRPTYPRQTGYSEGPMSSLDRLKAQKGRTRRAEARRVDQAD